LFRIDQKAEQKRAESRKKEKKGKHERKTNTKQRRRNRRGCYNFGKRRRIGENNAFLEL